MSMSVVNQLNLPITGLLQQASDEAFVKVSERLENDLSLPPERYTQTEP